MNWKIITNFATVYVCDQLCLIEGGSEKCYDINYQKFQHWKQKSSGYGHQVCIKPCPFGFWCLRKHFDEMKAEVVKHVEKFKVVRLSNQEMAKKIPIINTQKFQTISKFQNNSISKGNCWNDIPLLSEQQGCNESNICSFGQTPENTVKGFISYISIQYEKEVFNKDFREYIEKKYVELFTNKFGETPKHVSYLF